MSSVLSLPPALSEPSQLTERTQPRAWHDPALVHAAIDALVPSPVPAVVFTGLAAACVPALVGECVILLAEQPASAERADTSLTIRYPKEPKLAAAGSDLDRSSVVAALDGGGRAGQSRFRVTATFSWHGNGGVQDADQVIADLLVRAAVDVVDREWLTAELEQARDKVVNLGDALGTSRQIGQALGILMATYKLTAEQAFDLLRGVSQHTHRKLRDIADDVCHTGTLDLADPGQPADSRPRTHSSAAHLHSVDATPA